MLSPAIFYVSLTGVLLPSIHLVIFSSTFFRAYQRRDALRKYCIAVIVFCSCCLIATNGPAEAACQSLLRYIAGTLALVLAIQDASDLDKPTR